MTERSTLTTAEQAIQNLNPLGRSRDASPGLLTFYRIFSLLSWAFFVGSAVIYTFKRPKGAGHHDYHTIWEQNRLHPSPFSISPLVTTIYWLALFILQVPFVASVFALNLEANSHSALLAGHFVSGSVLGSLIIHLWVRSWLWSAFAVALINFFNLAIGYLSVPPVRTGPVLSAGDSHDSTSTEDGLVSSRLPASLPGGRSQPANGLELSFRLVQHYAVIAGPWAFSFLSLFWIGAAAANIHSFIGRVFANIFIWSFFFFGALILAAFNDWVMCGCLAAVTASIGVHQFVLHTFALQWIFAFTITGLLTTGSVVVATVAITRRLRGPATGERQSLLRG